MNVSDPAWQIFAALQSGADPKSIDQSLARDEALDVVLSELISDVAPNQEVLQKRFYSLCRNRCSKQNNRRAIDRRRFRATHRRGGSDFGSMLLSAPEVSVLKELEFRQLIDLIRRVLVEEEVRLLIEIAEGRSYSDMASDRNITVSSVKSKAFRIREKVRNSSLSERVAAAVRPASCCSSG